MQGCFDGGEAAVASPFRLVTAETIREICTLLGLPRQVRASRRDVLLFIGCCAM